MLMCIDRMYHVIIGSSTKRCVAFLTVVGGLFSLNNMVCHYHGYVSGDCLLSTRVDHHSSIIWDNLLYVVRSIEHANI